jgi:hypothetical protein
MKFRGARGVGLILMLMLAALSAGCSTSNLNLFGSSSKSDTATTGTPGGTPANVTNADATDEDLSCPDVSVRTGASTLTIGSGKPELADDPSAMSLRYQGSIVQTARDCQTRNGVMTMKVGIEGRIIVGPAGGPGQINVPLRIAVVHEGAAPRTVMSKLTMIPVTVLEGQGNISFTHVDPDVSFPVPKPSSDLEQYIVYVGFDPLAAQRSQRPAKPRRKR